jgi:hypothetical protein
MRPPKHKQLRLFRDGVQFCSGLVDLVVGVRHHGGGGHRLALAGERFVFVSTDRSGPFTPYLSIKGTAHVEEGGVSELLDKLNMAMFAPGTGFRPPDAPPGYLTHLTIEKVGGVGPWAS